MRFRFSLEPLLESRRVNEASKRRSFAQACATRRETVAALERLASFASAGARQLQRAALGGQTALARIYDDRLREIRSAAVREEARAIAATAVCERAGAELARAHRERQTLERLRERRLRAFNAERARREELELDEANARRRPELR